MRGNATTAGATNNTTNNHNNNNNPTTNNNWTGGTTNATTNQGWFVGAPVTRFGLYMLWISFLYLELNGWHDKVSVDTNAIFQNYQWHRWIVGQFTFATLGETMVGCLWITHMSRRFEREMGSRKFLVWWIGSVGGITSLLLHLVYSQLVVMDNSYNNNNSSSSLHYSGPYPLVGALLLLFHIYTPRLHPKFVGCCGILYFSEKSLGYLFCAQILLYHGYSSIIPCFLGAMSSLWMVTWGFQFWEDIPNWIVLPWIRIVSRFMVLDSSASMVLIPRVPLPAATAGIGAVGVGRQQQTMPYFDMPTPAPPQLLPPPDEESIQQLTILGFERDTVIRALRQSHNNIERAADWLLSGNGN